ncbi:MAG: DUF4278 domain-containing protein [Geminocystis sp.]|nr:DUF4278 domain-containing protein [Geminocystis sp.]HIK36799.1 hypothetical protein [Geminocystis sp. M7585_C2015_104]MCS7146889.1 DUF4278 domain-containing protein [Geminocystis sp.]MCX8078909.1 DUF4278 domain-containing protein [Geminocystis sp.]MDW8115714.1 hypothetical protein [Geminocystis sp.]
MELIICLTVVLSVFLVLVVGIIGLINAPTPVLLVILAAGLLLTQKSIDSVTAGEDILIKEEDKNRIEQVQTQSGNLGGKSTLIYRGINYNNGVRGNRRVAQFKGLQYRGVKIKTNTPRDEVV